MALRACFTLTLIVILIAAASASNVVELTPDTFDKTIVSGNWMVEFFAPWCGHCKRLAPAWEELADAAVTENFKVAKMDCDAHKAFCGNFGVRGFPTIKFFQDGKTIYDHPASGQRTKEALLRFATAEYLKEQGKPTPYDLAVRASGGSIAAARAKANAGGFLEQIEAALPSTIQKAVDWMRSHVELACLLAGSIATILGFIVGRASKPSWKPNPPVNPPAPSPAPSSPAASPANASTPASTEGVQKRKNVKK